MKTYKIPQSFLKAVSCNFYSHLKAGAIGSKILKLENNSFIKQYYMHKF